MQLEPVCLYKPITHFAKKPSQSQLNTLSFLLPFVISEVVTFATLFPGLFSVEVCLHGVGSTLMEDFGCVFLVGCSMNCMKFDTQSHMCAKSWNDHPPQKLNFETNNGQNYLKLYRYQSIPKKVASVKGKVSTTFTSSSKLVNVYLYQIVFMTTH